MIKHKGVTLVELLIVLIVIGILASFSVASATKIVRNMKTAAIFNEMIVIETGARFYYRDVGERPYGTLSGAGTCATWNADSIEVFMDGERSGTPIDGWAVLT